MISPKWFIVLLGLCSALISYAQQQSGEVIPEQCGTDWYSQMQFKDHPELKQLQDSFDLQLYRLITQGTVERQTYPHQTASQVVYTIPVVVHIIHNNGPENITDNRVHTAIAHLNDAFRNFGFYYDASDSVDIGIQFCLAQQDTNGNPTTGITRTQSSIWAPFFSSNDDLAMKTATRWDPLHYYNIWVVGGISGNISGYASNWVGGPVDGVVCDRFHFGNSVTGSTTLVHETGHYLNLLHTFQAGCNNTNCLLNGDRVCDTPPDGSNAFPSSCSQIVNTCLTDTADLSSNNPFRPVSLGGLGDQNDPITNFMDYTLTTCRTVLTAGQRTRMRYFLLNNRTGLVNSLLCYPPCAFGPTALPTVSDTVVEVNDTIMLTGNLISGIGSWFVDGVFYSFNDTALSFSSYGMHVIEYCTVDTCSSCSEFNVWVAECSKEYQACNWITGTQMKLEFHPDTVHHTAVFPPDFSEYYGSASYSDYLGRLVLYTNGKTVWNGQYDTIPNGDVLDPNGSFGSQPVSIVPRPGHSGEFYIFTAHWAYVKAHRVDMNMNNGAGLVVMKDSLIIASVTGSIITTQHCNGSDYWLIAHKYGDDQYLAYQVTASGVLPPVISHAGSVVQWSWTVGGMKISPDGRRIAMGMGNGRKLEVFDFNPATGTIGGNPLMIAKINDNMHGVEFSPNSKRLYVGCDNTKRVYQYNLAAPDSASIVASEMNILTGMLTPVYALQLTLRGEILITRNSYFISAIRQPDSLGTAANFIQTHFPYTTTSTRCLPPTVCSYLSDIDIKKLAGPDTVCEGSVNTYYYPSRYCGDSTVWIVNGDATVQMSSADSITLTINSGSAVQLIGMRYGTCRIFCDTMTIVVNPSPVFSIGPDTSACASLTIAPDTTYPGAVYVWQNNSSDSTVSAAQSGYYWLEITDTSGCSFRDTAIITIHPVPSVNIGPDTAVCSPSTVLLTPTVPYAIYAWQDSSTQSVYTAAATGTYWLDAVDTNGCTGSDTVLVQVHPAPAVSIVGVPVLFCSNDAAVSLTGVPSSGSWSGPGVSGFLFDPAVAGPGQHSIVYTYIDTNGCTGVDSLTVTVDICTGEADQVHDSGITTYCFPNPSDMATTILFGNPGNDPLEFCLYDSRGRIVAREFNITGSSLLIETSGLDEGMYFYSLTLRSGSVLRRGRIQVMH